ncbi:MAG: NUDIX hydrolase [Candidatus Nanopelagicaceae bacterium]
MTEKSREMPKKRVGAGVAIVDENLRILLVKPTYKDTWEVPGGMVELDESPRQGARRECLEELGFDVEIGRLLVIDWVNQGRAAGEGLLFIYATGPVDASRIILPSEELRSWEWCDHEAVLARVQDFKARRLFAALDALRNGTFLELENGNLT